MLKVTKRSSRTKELWLNWRRLQTPYMTALWSIHNSQEIVHQRPPGRRTASVRCMWAKKTIISTMTEIWYLNWNYINVEIISILKMKLFHVEAISFKSWLLTSSFQAFNLLQIILKRQRLNAIDARCCTKDSITRLLNCVKRNS